MGKRTVYSCDICGEEFADKRSLWRVALPALRDDGYGNESVRGHEFELCDHCKDKLEQLIIKYFAEIHVDAYGAMTQNVIRKDSPDEIIETLKKLHLACDTETSDLWRSQMDAIEVKHQEEIEKLKAEHEEDLESMQVDIGELEDELERLRDVKDNLFETNFKLTAQLQAFGVDADAGNLSADPWAVHQLLLTNKRLMALLSQHGISLDELSDTVDEDAGEGEADVETESITG